MKRARGATLKPRDDEEAARDSLAIARKQYTAGVNSHIAVLIAERQYIQARQSRIVAQAARYTDSATLFRRLGMGAKSKAAVRRIAQAGSDASSVAAGKRLEVLRPQIEHALKGGTSLRKAAEELNLRGVESSRGGRWHAPSHLKAARKLGLR